MNLASGAQKNTKMTAFFNNNFGEDRWRRAGSEERLLPPGETAGEIPEGHGRGQALAKRGDGPLESSLRLGPQGTGASAKAVFHLDICSERCAFTFGQCSLVKFTLWSIFFFYSLAGYFVRRLFLFEEIFWSNCNDYAVLVVTQGSYLWNWYNRDFGFQSETCFRSSQHNLFYLFNLYLTRQVIKNRFLFPMAAWQKANTLEGRGDGLI